MPSKKAAPKAKANSKKPIRREVGAVVCFLLGVFSVLGLFNAEGTLLRWLTTGLIFVVGKGAYVAPLCFAAAGFILLLHRGKPVQARVTCLMFTPLILGSAPLLWDAEAEEGGALSGQLARGTHALLGSVGGTILYAVLFIILFMVAFRISIPAIIDSLKSRPAPVPYEPEPEKPKPERLEKPKPEKPEKPEPPEKLRAVGKKMDLSVLTKAFEEPVFPDEEAKPESDEPVKVPIFIFDDKPIGDPKPEKPKLKPAPAPPPEPPKPKIVNLAPPPPAVSSYPYPPLSLLQASVPGSDNLPDADGETLSVTTRLADVVQSFRIDAKPVNVVRGPSVARYEFELSQGTSLTKLTSRATDIALNLGVDGVRIAPVSGKANIVGIEVPNRLVSTVFLRDVLDNSDFRDAKSKLTFALGKDIGGAGVLADISKLTHLLVAGTTGSGKSVCVNSLIISLLYKSSPDEVRVILIDPKMVELGIYNGIPHLLAPVVTDPKKASAALQWAVFEMEKRYRMLQEQGVRDIFSYNKAVEGTDAVKMPQIVIIIDELADLMMVAGKEVEESVIRIAQKARAAGMHLVLATQRPSANVITGLMKSNIPSRIAFAVASGIDSRIILDETGAEDLIGRGDMLFAPLGSKMSRVQGCLITGKEVETVVDYIKLNSAASYSEEVIKQIEAPAPEKGAAKKPKAKPDDDYGEDEDDEAWDSMLEPAMDMILEVGQASTSMLQRRLKLGYARAARVVDQLERRGLLGQPEGAKPRQILVTWEQWQELKDQ
ncbi:hypothetical protein FACS18949_12600 [Clostridia bacterium]|nr:hypothetical protein FACS18949_12600 [Clostridia bacterium]